jgi:hypothetical protein
MKNHKRIGAWAGAAGAIVDDDHHDAAAKPAKSKVAVLLVLSYFRCVWQDVVSVMKEWWRLFCASEEAVFEEWNGSDETLAVTTNEPKLYCQNTTNQ